MSKKVENEVLTRKDLSKAFLRYCLWRQTCFNYETMQSGGWVFAMNPSLKKIYKDDEIVAEKDKKYFQFFNCNPWFGLLLFGSCLAIESTQEDNATDTAVTLRTALMGPLAGLGDSLIFILPSTILGSIAAYNAIAGSAVGLVIAIVFSIILWSIFYRLAFVAYDKGIGFVTDHSKQLKNITAAVSALGLIVVGSLISTNVKLNISYTFTMGEVTQSIQDLLNYIMPNFTGVVAVALIYWGFSFKKMTSGKMVWIIILASLILAFFGICS